MTVIENPPRGVTIVNRGAVRRGRAVIAAMRADGRDCLPSQDNAADFDTTSNPGQPAPPIVSKRALAGRGGPDRADVQATVRHLPATPLA